MLSAEGCILFPGNVVEWSRLSRAKDIHLCLDKLYLYQSPSVKNGEEKIQSLSIYTVDGVHSSLHIRPCLLLQTKMVLDIGWYKGSNEFS